MKLSPSVAMLGIAAAVVSLPVLASRAAAERPAITLGTTHDKICEQITRLGDSLADLLEAAGCPGWIDPADETVLHRIVVDYHKPGPAVSTVYRDDPYCQALEHELSEVEEREWQYGCP